DVNARNVPSDLYGAAKGSWDDAVEFGEQFGYRNAQATVLAQTGTIGFMMDCDTTGVEPDIALVKYKKLVGGGMMKIVNQTVPMALRKLGYTQPQVDAIIEYIDKNETVEGAAGLKDSDLQVFDCAFKAAKGQRSIHYMGHIKMMGATQPFISGAISKTVNVPKEATVDDIAQAYVQSWKLGAKAISIYRDGSKRTQPLNTSRDKTAAEIAQQAAASMVTGPIRRKLPDERQAITHKFDIQGHEGYITVGLFKDGQPGEIFRWMATKFRSAEAQFHAGVNGRELEEPASRAEQLPLPSSAAAANQPAATAGRAAPYSTIQNQEDAPPCSTCGAIMIRSGAC